MNPRLLPALGAMACAMACTRLFILPLREISRTQFDLPEDGAALTVALVMLAHMLRPALGLAVESSARCGFDTRWWIRLTAALAIAAGFTVSPAARPGCIALLALVVSASVIAEIVACAAIAGEQSRGVPASIIGSARAFTAIAIAMAIGPLSGWIATAPSNWLGPLTGCLMLLVLLTSLAMPRPRAQVRTQERAPVRRETLAAAALSFVFYAVPGFGTRLYYKQTLDLHFSPLLIGWLDALNNLCALAGALAYARLRRRRPLPRALPAVLAAYALSSAIYLPYAGGWVAPAVEAANGLLSAAGLAAIAEVMIRGVGRDGSPLAMALILCAANVAVYLSDFLGSRLAAAASLSFRESVLLNVAGYAALAASVYVRRDRLAGLAAGSG